MALNTDDFIDLIAEIKNASKDLNSTELVFISEWLFELPGQSLEIANQMLHTIYNIPTGWNGYGETDLTKMVKIGFLEKLSEINEDPGTMRKVIKFKINHDFKIERSV